jgi:hypothetical protein
MEITGRQTWSTLLSRMLWALLPIAFLFWLYSDGLKVWFINDDFAWLGLLHEVHASRSLLNALFAPEAQGTIRPWSDRGFFLLFESLFGLDSLPFRICVFITMAANLTLVAWITRRIAGSPAEAPIKGVRQAAGFLAAILWIANASLTTVMAWSSAYNEALCPLFLLTALTCFIRYIETGRRVFWWWQLVVFTLGFGALEVNVVYPAIAAAYVVFVAEAARRRKLLLSLTPLFCISVVYFLVHTAVAPLPRDGAYGVHIDGRIFRSLALYWKWSLLPPAWSIGGRIGRTGLAVFWIPTLALSAFVVREIAKKRYQVLFCLSWFLIALAPMLPLPGHHSDYYLTVPVIGLAMLGGIGISRAIGAVSTWRLLRPICVCAALILLAAYLRVMVPTVRASTRWWLDRSLNVRGLVLGVRAAQEAHPGKTIVLDGINSDLYDSSIGESAISSVGLNEAYLTPASRDTIHPTEDFGKLSHLVLDPASLRRAITHEQVVIYSDVGDHLRNVTGVWERSVWNRPPSSQTRFNHISDPVPRRVEVGNPLLAYLLGPEWYELESGVRWMPRRATVRLGGPASRMDKLLLEGDCSEQQLKAGPLHLLVSVDGIPLAGTQIGNAESHFRRLLVVPPSLVGRDSVEVAISVDRVIHEEGGRELGLVFGTVAFE